MIRSTTRAVLAGGAALALCATAAQATTYTFSGSTDSGPLQGATFSGQFSYSDVGLPSDGEVALSSFTLSFAGRAYTLASATSAATAAFAGGSFVGLSYLDDASADTALRPQVGFTPGFVALGDAYFAYVGSGGLGGFGSYGVSAVPEPAAWLLLALGGAAVARRAARAQAALR